MIYLVSNQTNAFGGEFNQITLEESFSILNNLNVILENYQLIQEINKNNNINSIKKNKI